MRSASDDDAFNAVHALVLAGEYLDNIPGIPVAEPAGGGTWARRHGQSAYRRVYRRGSAEHQRARRAGLTDRLPALPLAPASAIEQAEAALGYSLPPLLKRLYLEVGNGGFGPGYGILGVDGGHRDDTGQTALDWYRQAHSQPSAHWAFLPATLLPLCHWGCAIYSFADCSHPDGTVWAWDPNPGPADERALFLHAPTLSGWLDSWARGTLSQPALVEDPLTKQWRGATDYERAAWTAELDSADAE